MIAYILPMAAQHAAEILRPRQVRRSAEDYATDLSLTQFQGPGWRAEERIDFALHEELHRVEFGPGDPADIAGGFEPDLLGHDREQQVRGRADELDPHRSPLQ